jgi:hypothetical protein
MYTIEYVKENLHSDWNFVEECDIVASDEETVLKGIVLEHEDKHYLHVVIEGTDISMSGFGGMLSPMFLHVVPNDFSGHHEEGPHTIYVSAALKKGSKFSPGCKR